jgi:hypothetical protein
MQKFSASVFALCLGLGTTAHAEPTTTRYVQQGLYVGGHALIDDPTNCFHGLIGLHAAEETTKQGGNATSTRALLAGFGGYNSCLQTNFGADENSFPLEIPLDTQSFTYNANIRIRVVSTDNAHLNDPPTYVQFTATITIKATGALEKSRVNTMTKLGTNKIVVHSNGVMREATFTVTNAKLGDAPINFLPANGDIGTMKNAKIEITRE